MITITEGDVGLIWLRAIGADGPIDLTGATFESKVKHPRKGARVFADARHAIGPNQNTEDGRGWFSLELQAGDWSDTSTPLVEGASQTIVSKVTQASSVTSFRGESLLTILAY